jgi:hypothetical protein
MGEIQEPKRLARPEVTPRHRGVRPVFLLTLALTLALAVLVTTRMRRAAEVPAHGGQQADWFSTHKALCNAVEVNTLLATNGPPSSLQGTAQRAGCLAIAGKVDAARQAILGLAPPDRNAAVDYVFLVAHPVADAGDDESAGPIMELVVAFQPDQFMALYHAGMAKAITGDDDKARLYLTRFLAIYQSPDGWNQNARKALDALDRPRAERTVKQGSEGSIVY